MKASLALVLASSLLAAASPIKRAVFTDYVTDIVMVTVTVDPATSTKTSSTHTTVAKTTTTTVPTTTQAPPTTSTPQVHTITLTQSPSPPPPPPAPVTTQAAAQQAAVQQEAPAAAPPPSTTAQAAPSEPTDFASTAVYHHNLHRSNHSAPAVSWDSDLANYAAQAASACVFAHNLSPGSDTGPYGQNIASYGASDADSISASQVVAQAVTDLWYNNEIEQFPSNGYGESDPDMSNFEAWGHFTQVVWVGSTSVGCASQLCPAGTIYSGMDSWFTVCNYRSEGNMAGSYGTNVLPPQGAPVATA